MSSLKIPVDLDTELLAAEFESRSAHEVISWALDEFGSRVAVCTSFQADGMVILDIAHSIDPSVKVFTIDTGRLPCETHELIDEVRDRYGIAIEVYHPDHEDLAAYVTKHGSNSFYRSVSLRMLCCELRKVEPLNRALSGRDAWIAGLRRGQSENRASTGKVERDAAHGNILKINPLADWTEQQVWDHVRNNNVPYNKLYDHGYTSIGCEPCTRAVGPGEDSRAGRWWWETGVPKECGIHLTPADRKIVAAIDSGQG